MAEAAIKTKRDPINLIKWGGAIVSILWMIAMGWFMIGDRYLETGAFGPGELFEERYAQKVKDCRGSFNQRYECKSAVIRDRNIKTFYFWAERMGIVLGPPLVILVIWLGIYFFVERGREAERRKVRLERKEREAEEERQRTIEAGRKRAEEAKAKAEAAKAEKEGAKQKTEDGIDKVYEAPDEEEAVDGETGLGHHHVLLIEDDRDTVEALTSALKPAGYMVNAAADVDSAMGGFGDSPYDVIVVNFTREGAAETVKGVKQMRDAKPAVKVLAMSAGFGSLSAEKAAATAQRIGADEVIAKPIEEEGLRAAVARVLR